MSARRPNDGKPLPFEDLVSIGADLLFVKEACQRLVAILNVNEPDTLVAAALWMAAVIHYHRCFVSGKRRWLDASAITDLTSGEKDLHEYVVTERNHVLAHVVQPRERVIGIEPSTVEAIVGYQARLRRDVVPSADVVGRVADLARAIGKIVAADLRPWLETDGSRRRASD